MTLNRWAAKRDATEPVVVDYLRACGALVQRLSTKDVPDLLVGLYGRWFLLECKTGPKPLTEGQQVWLAAARHKGLPVHVVRSLEDAEDVVRLLSRVAQ